MSADPSLILIIEDDPDIREALGDLLVSEGYQIQTAENGELALQFLRSSRIRPSLILLDLMMPVLDGLGFLNLKNEDSSLRSIPVVVLSAMGQLPSTPGVATVLRKPLEIEQILNSVRNYAR